MRIVNDIANIHTADSFTCCSLLKLLHEIDMSFLHLHVSIISISLALHNWAVFSRLCASALLCGRDQDCLKLFSTKTLMRIVF